MKNDEILDKFANELLKLSYTHFSWTFLPEVSCIEGPGCYEVEEVGVLLEVLDVPWE
jgi:hypothetical protein